VVHCFELGRGLLHQLGDYHFKRTLFQGVHYINDSITVLSWQHCLKLTYIFCSRKFKCIRLNITANIKTKCDKEMILIALCTCSVHAVNSFYWWYGNRIFWMLYFHACSCVTVKYKNQMRIILSDEILGINSSIVSYILGMAVLCFAVSCTQYVAEVTCFGHPLHDWFLRYPVLLKGQFWSVH